MLAKLEEFSSLYEQRPFKGNFGGMHSPHMFLFWFVLQHLKPKAIIESGVWRGQGTWFMERACPDAALYCIDIRPDFIYYRSKRATYFDRDFSMLDWSALPKDDTVVFFDDHRNAVEACKTAKWFGFRHLLFEDNYPPSQGDCYSLKKAFAGVGFKMVPAQSPWVRTKKAIERALGIAKYRYPQISPNDTDAKHLRKHLEVYAELPPVFKTENTYWGDPWKEPAYPTVEPLLQKLEHDYQRILLEEAPTYHWMCYARLRH